MKPDLFAKVEIRWPGGEVTGGTAYAVAPDLLLTAHHVVDPRWEEGLDRSGEEAQVRIQLESGQVFECGAEALITPGTEELDAALLRVPEPIDGAPSAAVLSTRDRLPIDGSWGTRGYPVAAHGARVSVKGTTHEFSALAQVPERLEQLDRLCVRRQRGAGPAAQLGHSGLERAAQLLEARGLGGRAVGRLAGVGLEVVQRGRMAQAHRRVLGEEVGVGLAREVVH